MSLKGFDPRWKDFPDYIIGITKQIWEDREIATLHEFYSDDILVRSPAAIVKGNKNVIASTMATLSEFPDRTLFAEDVVWSGSAEEGFLSSHRLLTTATHTGDGVYGDASGKPLVYRIIADCHAINNQINDEWIIRDQGAIVNQLGTTAKDYASDMIHSEGGVEKAKHPFTPDQDIPGPYQGHGNDNEWGQRYAAILNAIMNADLAVVKREYDRACELNYPGGEQGHSFAFVDKFWLGLRAAFPSAKFTIDHQIGRDDDNMPPRSALRWSLHGKHDGWGAFGAPSGAEVYIMGMSHAEFGLWGLRREYVLYDEIAIWKQILLHSGDV